MFALLRALFVLIVVSIAFTYWRQKRTGDVYWQQVQRWVWVFAASLTGVVAIGLFVQRLFFTAD